MDAADQLGQRSLPYAFVPAPVRFAPSATLRIRTCQTAHAYRAKRHYRNFCPPAVGRAVRQCLFKRRVGLPPHPGPRRQSRTEVQDLAGWLPVQRWMVESQSCNWQAIGAFSSHSVSPPTRRRPRRPRRPGLRQENDRRKNSSSSSSSSKAVVVCTHHPAPEANSQRPPFACGRVVLSVRAFEHRRILRCRQRHSRQ